MKTPWDDMGELSDPEMLVWIVIVLVVGSFAMIVVAKIAEIVSDWRRPKTVNKPPVYWRNIA